MNQQPQSLRDQAYTLFQAGRLSEAQRAFETWCRDHPNDAEALTTLGISHGIQAAWNEAEARLRQAISADPTYGDAHINLGVVLEANNQLEAAVASYREALRLNPGQAALHHNIGIVLGKRGERAAAADQYREALRLNPGFGPAHYSLGTILEADGKLREAEDCYRTAVRLDPRLVEAHYNLGNVLRSQGKQREAVVCYETALRLDPKHASARNNLGNAFTDLNEHAQAADCFRAVLNLNPRHIGALTNLGNTLAKLKDYPAAIGLFQKALQMQPDFILALNSLGLAYFELRLNRQALESFERALRINPDDADANANTGWVHAKAGRYAEALPYFRKALRTRPDAALYISMGQTLNYEGRLEEAMECFDEGRRLNPSLSNESYLFTMNYFAKFTPREIFEEHRRWGEIADRVPDPLPPVRHRADPDRPLRVGYVTPDLREHSVAYFFEPILQHHDRKQFETFCYVEISQPKFDATCERLQALSGHWINTCGLSDRELAERVRADGIDVLVDLAGHTGNNRLLAFAYRPAPVQITYLGYCNTTGLPAIQYRLTDEWADPTGQEQFNTEELVRLPRGFLCHLPPTGSPPVADGPVSSVGHITFGSFNIVAKTTPEVVALWSEILKAVPDSRLIMKNRSFSETNTRERYYRMFQQNGIAPDRVELIGWLPAHDSHLELYSRVDIGLDTFPYNGTTTTCEALWMGVPVICLAGERHAARVGVSLLSRLGLTELIAETPQRYIELAQRLSKDIPRLTEIRRGLRARIRASTLGDGAAFTRELEEAYRRLWKRRCGDLPPSSKPGAEGDRGAVPNAAPGILSNHASHADIDENTRLCSGGAKIPRIFNLQHLHNDNIGDRQCSPFNHFASLADSRVQLIDMSLSDPAVRTLSGEIVILGGGGSLNPWCWHEVIQPLLARGNRLIAWGIGHHHDNVPTHRYLRVPADDWRNSLARYAQDYPLENFALCGIRDYAMPHEYVPCVSCMSPLFERHYPVLYDVVLYEHGALEPIAIEGAPRMSNLGEKSFETVIAFLASGDTVITNSFHGAYWAQLLGRRVLVYEPWCTKFFTYKYPLTHANREDWRRRLGECRIHPQALADSRDCNRRFAHKVFDYTHRALDLHRSRGH